MSSQVLISEIENAPEDIRREVWDFLKLLKAKRASTRNVENPVQSVPDWSGLPAKWKAAWGDGYAPGTSMDSILDELRGTR